MKLRATIHLDIFKVTLRNEKKYLKSLNDHLREREKYLLKMSSTLNIIGVI